MTFTADEIYGLLPAAVRTRDAALGGPLQALLGVISGQVGVVQDDLRRFYADQFIETCADWAVPYIGELIGWTPLLPGVPGTAGNRAEVANTIGYRRRKGTLSALEQIGRDVTGRPVRAVERFQRLATTQSFAHLRPGNLAVADLRDGAALTRRGTAFDALARTAAVRRIAPRARAAAVPDAAPFGLTLHGGGEDNISNVSLFVWRWQAYAVTGQPAFALDARRFLFSPLGNDMPLFNQPPPRAAFAALTTRADVPQPIGRREFRDAPGAFYGAGGIRVTIDGAAVPVEAICVTALDTVGGRWPAPPAGKLALDPVLGRLMLAADRPAPRSVLVDYAYGFPAAIAGGPYDRSGAVARPAGAHWQAVVGGTATDLFGAPQTFAEAVARFNAQPAGTAGVIVLADFGVQAIGGSGPCRVTMLPGSSLLIVAGRLLAGKGDAATWSPAQARPTLIGDIVVEGHGTPAAGATPAGVTMNGVLLAGGVTVQGQVPLDVFIADCTLVPGRSLTREGGPAQPGAPSLTLASDGHALTLDRCILGPVFAAAGASVRVTASIVDAGSRFAVAYAGPDGAAEGGTLHAEDCTILGKVRTHLMALASNTLFVAARAAKDGWDAALWCTRRQTGCVRYSVLPEDAITPAQYQCLKAGTGNAALAPRFVSLTYGSPAYGLLACAAPVAVWTGADDESQIGAYRPLMETQGVANCRTRLGEYLPFGMEAGIMLVPCAPDAVPAAQPAYYGAPGHPIGRRFAPDDIPHDMAVGGALI